MALTRQNSLDWCLVLPFATRYVNLQASLCLKHKVAPRMRTLNINRTDVHSFPITRLDFREWDKHVTMPSDTNDTSEECRVPGVGKFTHGDYNLTHQHWVQQIVNSGYFGMHDTESAEGFHKKCMCLPSEPFSL